MTTHVISKQYTLKQSWPGNRQAREKRGHQVSQLHVLLQPVWKEHQICLDSRDAELKFPKPITQKCRILAL